MSISLFYMLINNFILSRSILSALIKSLAARNVLNININYTREVFNWSMCNFHLHININAHKQMLILFFSKRFILKPFFKSHESGDEDIKEKFHFYGIARENVLKMNEHLLVFRAVDRFKGNKNASSPKAENVNLNK